MNGKELKVVEYDLKFGQKPRMVNVFGVFRYKPNKRSTRVKKGHRQPYTKVEIKKIK